MSKLERLLNLIAALIHTVVPLTADEIRERVEGYGGNDVSFRRAFERDKDDLRAMGIPISVVIVPGTDPPLTGYRIDNREYAGAVPELTPDELATLHLAANLVRMPDLPIEGAFWKIGGAAGGRSGDTPGGEPMVALPTEAALAPLFRAVSDRRVAKFRYNDQQRQLEPQRLLFNRGHWYVSGFDRGRQDERIFRVDRIDGDVATGDRGGFASKPATRTEPIVRAWELGDGDAVEARILVDADQAVWAAHHVGTDAVVESRDDGSVVLSLTVRNPDAFRSFVLSFLEHAEVLEPPHLRSAIIDWLQTLAS